jgi:hypothetical protein
MLLMWRNEPRQSASQASLGRQERSEKQSHACPFRPLGMQFAGEGEHGRAWYMIICCCDTLRYNPLRGLGTNML